MRSDLLGLIAQARVAMIMRGHRADNLVLAIGPGTREILEAEAAPASAFDDDSRIFDMLVLDTDQGEGFWVVGTE